MAEPSSRQMARKGLSLGDGTPDDGMAIRFVYREGDPQAEIARVVEGLMTESLGPRLYAKLMEQAQKPREE